MDHAKRSALVLRVLSTAVLLPVAVAAIWIGGWALALIVISSAGFMGWEWGRISLADAGANAGVSIVAIEIVGVAAAALTAPWVGLAVVAAGAVAVLIARTVRRDRGAVWAGVGVAWIGIPCISIIWLAATAADGRAMVLWLCAVVWATDSAAYAVGSSVGGPRLAPRWSPRKTWAGALGGLAAAGAVGLFSAWIKDIPHIWPLFWTSLGLSAMAQLGDLAESIAKRRYGVKDSSGLIPGHGGLLDRLDGLLAAAPAAAGLALLGGGGLLAWR